MKTTELSQRIEALRNFGIEVENDPSTFGFYGLNDAAIETDEGEFAVLTDDEADEACYEYIEQTVWAFNKSFLDAHSEAIASLTEEQFKPIQEGCESSNAAILAMIDDFQHFAEDAIKADGRGHFLNVYDGNEFESGDFFIYQIN